MRFWTGAAVFVAVCLLAVQSAATTAVYRSDFWDLLHIEGTQYKWFGSLEEMTQEASVVVKGRITSVTQGRTITPEPQYAARASAHYLNATLAVEEVLNGSLFVPSKTITVELFAPNPAAIPAIIDQYPKGQGVFFLLNKAVHPATAHLPEGERAAEAKYYEIIGEQATLMDIEGEVKVRDGVPAGQFPWDRDGQRFETLLIEIRAIE